MVWLQTGWWQCGQTIKPRQRQSNHQSQSLHYFHAAHDRVNLIDSSESPYPVLPQTNSVTPIMSYMNLHYRTVYTHWKTIGSGSQRQLQAQRNPPSEELLISAFVPDTPHCQCFDSRSASRMSITFCFRRATMLKYFCRYVLRCWAPIA